MNVNVIELKSKKLKFEIFKENRKKLEFVYYSVQYIRPLEGVALYSKYEFRNWIVSVNI